MQLTNSTGLTLDSFTLGYTGEQWRVVNQGVDRLFLEYGVFAPGGNRLAANNMTGWTSIADLTFTAPRSNRTNATSIDGNADANRVALSNTVTGVNWAPGQELWIRWRDTGTQQMMGIDDVSFSAVPEPTTTLFIGLGALLLTSRRRRSC